MNFEQDEPTRAGLVDITANPHAERLALAAMILDSDLVLDAHHKYNITASDFFDSGHARLYTTLVDLVVEQGIGIDTTILIDELIKRFGIDYAEANALATLYTVADDPGLFDRFEQHVRLLKTASTARRWQTAAREISEHVLSGSFDPDQIGAVAIETIRQHLPIVETDDGAGEDNPFGGDLGPEPTAGLGWVAHYADVMSELTASPRSFNVLIALVLGATATQGRAKIWPFGPAPTYANIFAAIVGDSSVYHKSTSQNGGRSVAQRAGLEKLLLPDSGTSEGLIAALSEQPAGLIVKDEIGRLFASDRVRYTQTLKADLTDLFDGQSIRRRLAGADIVVNKPFLSILGSTTPTRFFDSLGANDWDDGFVVRWIFAVPDAAPRFDLGTFYSEGEVDRRLNALAQNLRMVAAQSETMFAFEGDAFQTWATWQTERKRSAFEYGDGTANAITSRITTVAIKLALILAAVNGEWGRITPERMAAAIWLADMFRLNTWRLLNERSDHVVSGHKLQKVLATIRQQGGAAGCTKRVIMRAAHLKAHELRPVLEKLLSLGAVVPSDDQKRYRAIHDKLPVKNYV